jgi:hypothetical protein
MFKDIWIITLVAVLFLFIPSWVWSMQVYVLRGGDAASDSAVINALQARSHTPIVGVETPDFDGTQANLIDFDAVVILYNANWSRPLLSAGALAIRDYVAQGGGVVTSEWFIWRVHSDAILGPLMPVGQYCGYNSTPVTTYTQDMPDPLINNGLLPSLTFSLSNFDATESCLAPKQGATVFYRSSNGGGQPNASGLMGWSVNGGRIASFSTLLGISELANPDYRQLFVNTVEWVAH